MFQKPFYDTKDARQDSFDEARRSMKHKLIPGHFAYNAFMMSLTDEQKPFFENFEPHMMSNLNDKIKKFRESQRMRARPEISSPSKVKASEASVLRKDLRVSTGEISRLHTFDKARARDIPMSGKNTSVDITEKTRKALFNFEQQRLAHQKRHSGYGAGTSASHGAYFL